MEELTNKFSDLMKRHNAAFRMGKGDMTGQLQLLIQDYQGELDRRHQKALDDLQKNNKNFSTIIDIQ
jgi:uncharacterized protein YukE